VTQKPPDMRPKFVPVVAGSDYHAALLHQLAVNSDVRKNLGITPTPPQSAAAAQKARGAGRLRHVGVLKRPDVAAGQSTSAANTVGQRNPDEDTTSPYYQSGVGFFRFP
jgi:hypothetical protein